MTAEAFILFLASLAVLIWVLTKNKPSGGSGIPRGKTCFGG